MGFRSTCFFVMLAAAILLSGCSRESSVRENVTLRNNHSVVFVSTHPFKNPEAFADSVTNLSNPDSVLVPDTITVTINDTIYMMGFLKHYSERIGRYYWILDSLSKDSSGKFSKKEISKISKNATPIAWVYPQAGVYSPLFVAIDGNNATDTAGADQFIRVINTPPFLSVPKDTLWTKHKTPITFPIAALDSFGIIKDVKVDLDASKKKASPKTWKYQQIENTDSLLLTIPYDSNYVDSLGNQMIYVSVTDDDDNETLDSVHIHFNQLPKLELQFPRDGAIDNKNVAFFYQATDVDNPASLRYFIRAAKPRDNSGEAPVLNDGDIIALGIQETWFEIVTADKTNLLVEKNGSLYISKDGKINEEAGEMHADGIIYWDVWVTDGYDTVYADKISDNGKTRPRSFILGDPSTTTGTFKGIFKFDGLSESSYADASILFTDTEGNSVKAQIQENGYFEAKVPAGTYTLTVSDQVIGRGYPDYKEDDLRIKVGDTRDIGKIVLKDTSKPTIKLTKELDTFTTRNDVIVGRFIDKGSQVKAASAWIDDAAQEFSSLTFAKWSIDLVDLVDGEHTFKIVAQDSAGNVSDTLKQEFYVQATQISLVVNEKTSFMAKDTLRFTASIIDAKPSISTLTWIINVKGAKEVTTKVSDNKATLTVDENSLNKQFGTTLDRGVLYDMHVSSPQGATSGTVRFGFFGDGPIIYFVSPSNDSSITIGDPVEAVVYAYANNDDLSDETYDLTWSCDGATTCPATNELAGTVSWNNLGEHKLRVSIKNKDGKTAKDSIIVRVIADPPTVKIQSDEDTIRTKINSVYKIPVKASDKFGTINAIDASCNGMAGNQNFSLASLKPQKNVEDSIEINLPNTEDRNYKCIIKATDDDGETATDSLFFVIVLDPPSISLLTKSFALTILDQVNLSFNAVDTLGYIAKYEYGCHRNKDSIQYNFKEFNGVAPSVTMPKEPCMYYCAIRVIDDDNLTASDTATYQVLLAPPIVQAQGPYSVTIKDTLSLNAYAEDSIGYIAKYEWGCGSAGADVGFSHFSTSSPQYTAIMPSKPDDDYICIIRVTDDDGNSAMDTTHIEVVLAPPTVTVANETAVIRQGYNIILNAEANDFPNYPGEIVKREWSCGENTDVINSNWKSVSSFDTVWNAPAAVAKLYCVARATDDDGNIAQDTMVCSYSTDIPLITAKDKSLYAVPGDEISLGADTNSVWQGINWFNWQCFDQVSKKALETFSKLDYKSNYNQVVALKKGGADIPYFYVTRKLDYESKSMYCVISAEEASTKAVFYDTTYVNVIGITQKPKGVLSVADTIYPRSGNINQTGEALYFYSDGWGGYNSINGVIGDNNKREYWWKFGTLNDEFYKGLSSGHLDTSLAEFNDAFIRPTMETSFDVCLDFHDSSKAGANTAFMARHQADEVCKTIYVRKAWRNLAAVGDTVLEYNNETPIPPAITVVGTTPVAVYAVNTTTLHSKHYNGSEWKDISVPSISGTIKEVKMATNGSVAYLAVLTHDNKLSIYQSNGGTSSWTSYGTSIEKVTAMNITCKASSAPVISYIKDSKPYFSYLTKDAWTSIKISDKASQEINAVYANELLTFIYIKNTEDYTAYYAIYNSSYTKKAADKTIGNDIKGVNLASNGETIYMAFMNQDILNMKTGPYVYKGTISETRIDWNNGAGFNANIQPGTLAYNIHIAVNNGKVLIAFDDQWYKYSQSHVFYHDGTGWSPYGETDLPYFYSQFINTHGYYLRGYDPTLSISSDGKVYLSMLAWENAGGSGKNFGPIVMKYVADNWTVKDFKN